MTTDTPTERTTREEAQRMAYAAQFLDSEHATIDMQQLATDYLALLDERDALVDVLCRLRETLEVIMAQAAAIWDDENPVPSSHGTRLDIILYEAKSAHAALAATPAPDEG